MHCQSDVLLKMSLFVFNMSPTCLQQVSNMSSTCLQHVFNMSPTCLQHVFNMSPACLQHVSNMSSTCLQHVSNMFSTCLQHVFMLKTCLSCFRYRDMLETCLCICSSPLRCMVITLLIQILDIYYVSENALISCKIHKNKITLFFRYGL